jgi:ribosomal protein S21
LFILKRKLSRAGVWPTWQRHVAALSPGEKRRRKHATHMRRLSRSRMRQQAAEVRRS